MLQYWGGTLKKKFVKFVVQNLTSGGLLGVWGKWVKHAKYIYNIQDFNPEQVLAVTIIIYVPKDLNVDTASEELILQSRL